ncbi:S41 family peptidase [Candidatus Parcubacteria bacterium]|nr:S41 family peptidase [Candidatus Parcubacteria bacterium]
MQNKNLLSFIVIITIITTFVFGYMLGSTRDSVLLVGGVENQELGQPEDVDFSLFWDVWLLLEKKYPEKLGYQEMVYGAVAGMVDSLDDPYSSFFPPEEAKIFKEDVKGVFEGVGMEIGIRDDQLTVIAPLEGTPAQKAGFRSGDVIVKIDDTSTRDISIEEAVKLIRGVKGTEVILTIFRDGWAETQEIKVIRGVIKVPSLKWEEKEDNIAYIKLYHFSEEANVDFKNIAREVLDSPAEKIVLDLRNNPGGYLQVAQDITGWFLEKGEIITIEDFGDGEQKEYKASGSSRFLDYPIVILINQGSASASEIMAGALRDNRGIKLIGETSFGKGSVQEFKDLGDGSGLKVTVARWLTPNGSSISEVGLTPDIEIEMTIEDYDEGIDPQLEKAMEILKEL